MYACIPVYFGQSKGIFVDHLLAYLSFSPFWVSHALYRVVGYVSVLDSLRKITGRQSLVSFWKCYGRTFFPLHTNEKFGIDTFNLHTNSQANRRKDIGNSIRLLAFKMWCAFKHVTNANHAQNFQTEYNIIELDTNLCSLGRCRRFIQTR